MIRDRNENRSDKSAVSWVSGGNASEAPLDAFLLGLASGDD